MGDQGNKQVGQDQNADKKQVNQNQGQGNQQNQGGQKNQPESEQDRNKSQDRKQG